MLYEGLRLKRTWAEINLDYLTYNFKTIKNLINPSCKIMGIIKADAYGHGDRIIANHLIDCGVDYLGVSNIDEALSLRRSGVKIPILILGYTPVKFVDILYQYNITQTIYNFEYAYEISNAAEKQNVKIDAHIKLDTGMHRIGFRCEKDEFDINKLALIYKLNSVNITGIYTHFAVSSSDNKDDIDYTLYQFNTFKKVCDKLTNLGLNLGLRHCCNSGALIKYPYMQMDMVRPGIILYGLADSKECLEKVDIKPIMKLKTKVSMVKTIDAGESISYGRTYTAKKNMKIATICIGYADGFARALSNKAKVLINGKLAKIIGRICMDQSIIDITTINSVSEGDEVIIFGDEKCMIDDIAKLANTISHELLCSVSKRVPRLYIKNQMEYEFIDYIASI